MPQSEEHITNNGVGQQAQNQRSEAPPPTTGAEDHLAQPTQQHALAVDGPGTLRRAGPRHDNDKVCIEDIQILPTAQEVASLENSYLPFTLDNAAHHHPPGSPERLLDIHFRLLRAEFAEPLRRGMRALLSEVQANASNTSTTNGASQLSRLLARGGGQFKVEKSMTAYQLWGTGRLDMVLGHDPKYGTLLSISFESQVTREEMVRKSLCYGGTIAVVTSTKGRTTFAWGVNRSNDERNGEKSRHSVKVQLLRSEEMVSVLESGRRGDFQLLFEVPGTWYDAYAPVLGLLQTRRQEDLPFAQLLSRVTLVDTAGGMSMPSYCRAAGFTFDLSGLLGDDNSTSGSPPTRLMNPRSAFSKHFARAALKHQGSLNGEQVNAIVDSLTREVALVQGPPGFGKHLVVGALLSALLRSKVTPILILSSSNYAIDGVMGDVIDQGKEHRVVRLGRQISEERLVSYTLSNMIKDDYALRRAFSRTMVQKPMDGASTSTAFEQAV